LAAAYVARRHGEPTRAVSDKKQLHRGATRVDPDGGDDIGPRAELPVNGDVVADGQCPNTVKRHPPRLQQRPGDDRPAHPSGVGHDRNVRPWALAPQNVRPSLLARVSLTSSRGRTSGWR